MKKGKVAPAKKKKENSIPFIPRRSRRVSIRSGKQNDGDTWIEHLHVYDPVTKENRSYFMSQNTKMCVWDEPPSGAGHVVFLPLNWRR